jgi:hypothetical protein
VLNPSWEEVRGTVEGNAGDGSKVESGEAMGERGVAAKAVARQLHAAIERVREDMAKVEFWADAVTGFSEPVPDYDAKDVNVWLPSEQARRISPTGQDEPEEQTAAAKRR